MRDSQGVPWEIPCRGLGVVPRAVRASKHCGRHGGDGTPWVPPKVLPKSKRVSGAKGEWGLRDWGEIKERCGQRGGGREPCSWELEILQFTGPPGRSSNPPWAVLGKPATGTRTRRTFGGG